MRARNNGYAPFFSSFEPSIPNQQEQFWGINSKSESSHPCKRPNTYFESSEAKFFSGKWLLVSGKVVEKYKWNKILKAFLKSEHILRRNSEFAPQAPNQCPTQNPCLWPSPHQTIEKMVCICLNCLGSHFQREAWERFLNSIISPFWAKIIKSTAAPHTRDHARLTMRHVLA